MTRRVTRRITKHLTRPPTLHTVKVRGGPLQQQNATLKIIGRSIVNASRYLPIRNRAAALATRARPKDYLGQVAEIYNDFVKRWRYVRDPFGRELLHTSPEQIFGLVMGGRSESPGVGFGRGAGDCDDATVAIGAQLASIGFPVRIKTIAAQGMPAGPEMSHVFAEAAVPGHGWVAVDPVVWPKHGLGFVAPHSRSATYDLTGELLKTTGNAHGLGEIGDTMNFGDISDWTDLSGYDDAMTDGEEPLDFRVYGVKDFGIYADSMGMLGGMGIGAEVVTDYRGLAWTPAIEVAPHDYRYLQRVGRPYHGMLGLSDLCEPMVYDENMGFFKRLFKRIRKKVRSIGKKLLSKIPGGKYLMKLGKKVWSVAKRVVRPLAKFVGKYAAKLAPVAALIPGYGPAIAAGLYTAGKIANLMNKYDVAITGGGKGEPARLKFKSGNKAKAFQAALKKAASKQKHAMKAHKKKFRRHIARGAPPRYRRSSSSARRRMGTMFRRSPLRRSFSRMRSMFRPRGRRSFYGEYGAPTWESSSLMRRMF